MKRIVKEWTTKAGLKAVILFVNYSHHCGYVELPEALKHKNFTSYSGEDDQVSQMYVHGGITWQDTLEELGGLNSVGFDCAHLGDKTAYNPHGIFRTEAFCVSECESLAAQLKGML